MKYEASFIYQHEISIFLPHGTIMLEFGMVFVFIPLQRSNDLAYFKKGQRKVVKTIAAKFVAEEEEVDVQIEILLTFDT